MVLVIVPMLPGLANKVTPTNVHIPSALTYLFDINWLYGFVAACILYYALNIVFPDYGTLIPQVVHGDIEVVEGVSSGNASTDGDNAVAEKGLKTSEFQEERDARSWTFSKKTGFAWTEIPGMRGHQLIIPYELLREISFVQLEDQIQ
jgi:hypothetical protein